MHNFTGIPEGGIGSDEEDINDDDPLDPSGVPDEIAAEVDTMSPVEDDEEMEDIEETERRDKRRWMQNNTERKDMESKSGKDREYASKKLSQNFPASSSSNEWDIFIKVFEGLIELLVHETNRYAKREKNCQSFEVTLEEIMNFMGLLFLSGYNIRSSEKDYWSKAQDLECPIFAAAMSRNRFQEIKKFLHCADNANFGNEKMAKVKPLYDRNENIRRFGILHEILNIDEFMTPYYGRHSYKQFIRQKPIRFGFKSWIMASSTGMPYYVKIFEVMVFFWRLYEISTGTTIPNKEYRWSIVQTLVKRAKPERMHSKAPRSGPK
ncbi:piggyBac transposable element-derived protein 3-like [Macrobrachium rosenbergii]|uniref:piggyBac transposable element-derived protein 3-like n=1 Tax=Macrobrachium rosenbergii TaxID=79674 RepID=UPI0034D51E44